MQAVEDKVVQMACVMILNEVYEPLFCGYSCGSRPGRGAHDALDALHEGICRKRINWILDCDIEGFFDHLPHAKLMEIIGERAGRGKGFTGGKPAGSPDPESAIRIQTRDSTPNTQGRSRMR